LQLTPALERTLKEHRRLQQDLGVRSEHIFTYQGKRIKTRFRVSLLKVLKKAGLEDVTLHTLRHTFASQLVMAGVSLVDVKKLMGHQDYKTTLQYAHLSKEHVKRQVLKLPFADD
jgi:site-specific recombinase XerD